MITHSMTGLRRRTHVPPYTGTVTSTAAAVGGLSIALAATGAVPPIVAPFAAGLPACLALVAATVLRDRRDFYTWAREAGRQSAGPDGQSQSDLEVR